LTMILEMLTVYYVPYTVVVEDIASAHPPLRRTEGGTARREKVGCRRKSKEMQTEDAAQRRRPGCPNSHQQMHEGSASLHPNCFRSFLTSATSACISRCLEFMILVNLPVLI